MAKKKLSGKQKSWGMLKEGGLVAIGAFLIQRGATASETTTQALFLGAGLVALGIKYADKWFRREGK